MRHINKWCLNRHAHKTHTVLEINMHVTQKSISVLDDDLLLCKIFDNFHALSHGKISMTYVESTTKMVKKTI